MRELQNLHVFQLEKMQYGRNTGKWANLSFLLNLQLLSALLNVQPTIRVGHTLKDSLVESRELPPAITIVGFPLHHTSLLRLSTYLSLDIVEAGGLGFGATTASSVSIAAEYGDRHRTLSIGEIQDCPPLVQVTAEPLVKIQ
jgi:hypothetical protein